MTLLIVRHAEAGERAAWTGDDRRRPLTATGRRQSETLVDLYATQELDRILSSPARRCMDTVRPMAEHREMPLIEEDALSEATSFDLVDRLLHRCSADDVVLCSHGDVIGGIAIDLVQRGLLAPSPSWPKASTWVLDGWPEPETVRFLPAPVVV